MQLLLTLLRILGILILAVILLVLLVVLLVLLVPIRYQVWAESKANNSLYTKVRIHWLLHLISLTVEYRNEVTYRLKILGITVFDEKKAKKSGEGTPNGKEKRPTTDIQLPEPKETVAETKPIEAPKPNVESKPIEEKKIVGSEHQSDSIPDSAPKKSFREKLEDIWIKVMEFIASIPEKIAALLEKWADFQENIGERVDALLDKFDQLMQKKDRLMRQLRDEQNRFAVSESFRTVGKLFGHIRPQKLTVKGRLGFDDPAQTGQVFGIIGMLMPLYGEHIQLEAVFDEKVMEGELYLCGRTRSSSILWMVLRLILRKEVRQLIRQVQNVKGNQTQENRA